MQATRNEVDYGPSFNRKYFRTEAERAAHKARYLKDAAKRAAKAAAK